MSLSSRGDIEYWRICVPGKRFAMFRRHRAAWIGATCYSQTVALVSSTVCIKRDRRKKIVRDTYFQRLLPTPLNPAVHDFEAFCNPHFFYGLGCLPSQEPRLPIQEGQYSHCSLHFETWSRPMQRIFSGILLWSFEKGMWAVTSFSKLKSLVRLSVELRHVPAFLTGEGWCKCIPKSRSNALCSFGVDARVSFRLKLSVTVFLPPATHASASLIVDPAKQRLPDTFSIRRQRYVIFFPSQVSPNKNSDSNRFVSALFLSWLFIRPTKRDVPLSCGVVAVAASPSSLSLVASILVVRYRFKGGSPWKYSDAVLISKLAFGTVHT